MADSPAAAASGVVDGAWNGLKKVSNVLGEPMFLGGALLFPFVFGAYGAKLNAAAGVHLAGYAPADPNILSGFIGLYDNLWNGNMTLGAKTFFGKDIPGAYTKFTSHTAEVPTASGKAAAGAAKAKATGSIITGATATTGTTTGMSVASAAVTPAASTGAGIVAPGVIPGATTVNTVIGGKSAVFMAATATKTAGLGMASTFAAAGASGVAAGTAVATAATGAAAATGLSTTALIAGKVALSAAAMSFGVPVFI